MDKIKEDASWSSQGSATESSLPGSISHAETIEEEAAILTKDIKLHLSQKDDLLGNLKAQLKDLTSKLVESEMRLACQEKQIDDLKAANHIANKKLKESEKSRVLATKFLEATVRTETVLDKLDTCAAEDIIDIIESLVKGSKELNVSELREKAVKFAKTVMERQPLLAIPVLAAYDAAGDNLESTELEEIALETIRTNPASLMGEKSCALWNAERMESILADKRMMADALTMFRILSVWSNATSESGERRERKAMASGFLTKHIALESIDPSLLYSEVRTSGLVTDAQLVEAFGKQATLAKQSIPFAVSASSNGVVFKTSSSDLFEYTKLDWFTDSIMGHAMHSGVHKWSFFVQNCGKLFFGIAQASTELQTNTYVGCDHGSWSVDNGGHKYMDNKYVGSVKPVAKSIAANSTVKFVLKVRGGDKNCLEVSVDGEKFRTVFEGKSLRGDGSGFIPVVSTYGTAALRFLGFE